MTGLIAAVVLAAGKGHRWRGAGPKVLAPFEGRPLVAVAADAALSSGATPVVVVAGDTFQAIRTCLSARPVHVVRNPDPGSGIAVSIRSGLEHVPADARGCLILLADMPLVRAVHVKRLQAAFEASGGDHICVPTYRGRRGNPVLWPARYFTQLLNLQGDTGGRQLLKGQSGEVKDVEMDDDGVLVDVDTREALAAVAR
ncbi:MAG: nucleotidyltransferase family protein [Hyphomicrobiales bacterium]|nr:nucleotidyltransferase family protein [Hyphomicrobiales bacterium]